MNTNVNMDGQCHGCDNHCPADKLKCPRGMEYFGINNGSEERGRRFNPAEQDILKMSADDALIMLMRKCGHYLHHNAGQNANVNNSDLLSSLSDTEKDIMILLLQKCVRNWLN